MPLPYNELNISIMNRIILLSLVFYILLRELQSIYFNFPFNHIYVIKLIDSVY